MKTEKEVMLKIINLKIEKRHAGEINREYLSGQIHALRWVLDEIL